MLVPHDEIRSSIKGALGILSKDDKALSHFNMTPEGFWNSFKAIWIVLVPFMLSLLNQRDWLIQQFSLDLTSFPSALFFTTKTLWMGLEWALMPVLLWLAADILGIKSRYGPYIIARNWMSIVMAWIFFVPTLVRFAGLISLETMIFMQFLMLGLVLIYGYRVARMTLEKSVTFCFALVFADFILGVLVGEALWILLEPMMMARESADIS